MRIKFNPIKQLVKAPRKDGGDFDYISKTLPRINGEKLKAGIFNGTEIRKFFEN